MGHIAVWFGSWNGKIRLLSKTRVLRMVVYHLNAFFLNIQTHASLKDHCAPNEWRSEFSPPHLNLIKKSGSVKVL